MRNNVSEFKIFSGFLWVFIEKIGYSAISLLSTLILARFLSPYDFGVIGSVVIITSISNMVVESGLGAALVNKNDTTDEDYNTVFTFNFFMSCVLYALIFFTAPLVSSYFKIIVLEDVIRVLALTLIFNSFTLVQRTILIKKLLFKKQSLIALFSLFVSTIISVIVAYLGMGVWAIVFQLVLYSAIYSLTIFFIIRYIPKFQFSFSSFRELLRFGGRITLSSAIQVGYNDIISSILGKIYTIHITGLYTQSQKLISFPINIFRSLFDGAAFPYLSKIIDKDEFSKKCAQINRSIYLLAFPLLLVIPFNTEEIIKIVLGQKWIEANHIFSILSIGVIVLLIEIATLNILKSSGNAKPYLNIGVYKAVIGSLLLIFTLTFSIEILLSGVILNSVLSCLFAMYKVDNLTMYCFKNQLKDILFPLSIALLSNILALFIVKSFQFENGIVNVFFYMIFMLVIFISICLIFNIKEMSFIVKKIREKYD